MLKITFYPSHDDSSLSMATSEYQSIWDTDGDRVSKAIEAAFGLEFTEHSINALIFEGVSQSHPLCLRASYPSELKRAGIVHELCHRLSGDFMISVPDISEDLSLGLHKQINLVLYDLWVELYGQEFADENVKAKSERSQTYKQAWDWALQSSASERKSLFSKLKAVA